MSSLPKSELTEHKHHNCHEHLHEHLQEQEDKKADKDEKKPYVTGHFRYEGCPYDNEKDHEMATSVFGNAVVGFKSPPDDWTGPICQCAAKVAKHKAMLLRMSAASGGETSQTQEMEY